METSLRDLELRKTLVELYNKNKPVYFYSNNPEALPPKRTDDTDGIFPITIVSRTNNRIDDQLQNYNEFTTELCLSPPPGFLIEINGTDELLKRGYALLHPKIIQHKDSNTPIKILLFKVIDNEDLQLPFPVGLVAMVKCANYTYIRKQKGSIDSNSIEDPSSLNRSTYTNAFITKYENNKGRNSFFE